MGRGAPAHRFARGGGRLAGPADETGLRHRVASAEPAGLPGAERRRSGGVGAAVGGRGGLRLLRGRPAARGAARRGMPKGRRPLRRARERRQDAPVPLRDRRRRPRPGSLRVDRVRRGTRGRRFAAVPGAARAAVAGGGRIRRRTAKGAGQRRGALGAAGPPHPRRGPSGHRGRDGGVGADDREGPGETGRAGRTGEGVVDAVLPAAVPVLRRKRRIPADGRRRLSRRQPHETRGRGAARGAEPRRELEIALAAIRVARGRDARGQPRLAGPGVQRGALFGKGARRREDARILLHERSAVRTGAHRARPGREGRLRGGLLHHRDRALGSHLRVAPEPPLDADAAHRGLRREERPLPSGRRRDEARREGGDLSGRLASLANAPGRTEGGRRLLHALRAGEAPGGTGGGAGVRPPLGGGAGDSGDRPRARREAIPRVRRARSGLRQRALPRRGAGCAGRPDRDLPRGTAASGALRAAGRTARGGRRRRAGFRPRPAAPPAAEALHLRRGCESDGRGDRHGVPVARGLRARPGAFLPGPECGGGKRAHRRPRPGDSGGRERPRPGSPAKGAPGRRRGGSGGRRQPGPHAGGVRTKRSGRPHGFGDHGRNAALLRLVGRGTGGAGKSKLPP